MQNQSNLIIEKFSRSTNNIFGDKFSIPQNYIVYFEKEEDRSLNAYVGKNYISLKSEFYKLGYNFIFVPFLTEDIIGIENLLEYYFPQLTCFKIPNKVKSVYSETIFGISINKGLNDLSSLFNDKEDNCLSYNYDAILEWLDYKGTINSGFLLFEQVESAIGVSDFFYNQNNGGDFKLFFEDFQSYLIALNEVYEEWDMSLGYSLSAGDYSENLDEEAKDIIKEFETKLSKLKDSGQLLFIVPILKDILDKQTRKIDLHSISKLQISQKNKIWLPYFKREVEMSHLTKSVYFLFLKHPKGINLNELEVHKKELLSIYTSVSNQINYDKMVKSVEDIINLETKSIYTHLSRIKSSYYKIMDESYARNYIVSGNGDEDRKVLFNNSSVKWEFFDSNEDDEF